MAVPRRMENDSETREAALLRVLGPLLFRDSGEEKTIRLWRNKDGQPMWNWELEREMRDFPPVSLRAHMDRAFDGMGQRDAGGAPSLPEARTRKRRRTNPA
jgi:hypothetical protein